MKTKHKETFEAMRNFSHNSIESSIAYYLINSIKPQYKFTLSQNTEHINNNLVNILEEKSFPICFETINFLFESLLDKQYKSANGIVFTPKYISDFIYKSVLKKYNNLNNIKIIDPSCGCGIFLISAIEILKQRTNKSIKEIIQNHIFGLDISPVNTNRVILLFKIMGLLYDETIQDDEINIKCVNSLKENWKDIFLCEFDCVVGNPPYFNPHSLDKKQVDFLKQNFTTTSSGVFNIFYAFIEQGIKFLKNNGFMCLIVPNNFLTISAAKPLRDFLEPYLMELIDFKII